VYVELNLIRSESISQAHVLWKLGGNWAEWQLKVFKINYSSLKNPYIIRIVRQILIIWRLTLMTDLTITEIFNSFIKRVGEDQLANYSDMLGERLLDLSNKDTFILDKPSEMSDIIEGYKVLGNCEGYAEGLRMALTLMNMKDIDFKTELLKTIEKADKEIEKVYQNGLHL
jgi:hypothetical protein